MITWEVAAILLGFFAMVAVVSRKDGEAAFLIVVVAVIGGCVSNCVTVMGS